MSYRPGARFGPRAIRQASSRQSAMRGFNHRAGINPYLSWARILDCGDIPVTPIDNAVALAQMTEAFTELGSRAPASPSVLARPRLITLGGDHSLALPALRALRAIYGKPLRVIHFDGKRSSSFLLFSSSPLLPKTVLTRSQLTSTPGTLPSTRRPGRQSRRSSTTGPCSGWPAARVC